MAIQRLTYKDPTPTHAPPPNLTTRQRMHWYLDLQLRAYQAATRQTLYKPGTSPAEPDAPAECLTRETTLNKP